MIGGLERLYDLVLAVVLALLAAAGVLYLPETSISRVLVTLPVFLVLPGYVVVTALDPTWAAGSRGSDSSGGMLSEPMSSLGPPDANPNPIYYGVIRAVLTVAISVVVIPLWALVLIRMTGRFDPATVLLTTAGFVVAVAFLAAVRRLARSDAPHPPSLRALGSPVRSSSGGSALGLGVKALLVVSLLFAAGSFAFAAAETSEGDSYTEFYLLTQNESGGLVATGYPMSFGPNESRSLVVGVNNHEGTEERYTVVAEVQRVERTNGTDTPDRVLQQRELDRFQATIPAGGTWQQRHQVTPGMAGEDIRIRYFLYRGQAPDDPRAETAYRHLTLNVDVSVSDDGGGASSGTQTPTGQTSTPTGQTQTSTG